MASTVRLAPAVRQRQLAEASGVQQADISRIERGEIEPRETTLARLFAPLGRRIQVAKAATPDLHSQPA